MLRYHGKAVKMWMRVPQKPQNVWLFKLFLV